MIFTTNKSLKAWGRVLHDDDLAQAIVDRVLERGRLIRLDGPSVRTLHVNLDEVIQSRRHQITVSGVGQRCYRCFNEEMSARVGVAFDHTPLDPIVLADHDGVPRTFEIRSMLVATGHAMRAEEVPRRERGGYRFAVLGDFEADAWQLFQRLYQKMRRELAVRHIEQTEHGWQLIDGDRLAGRIEWDDDADGVTPLLVVDGKALTWDEVSEMLMSHEGFTLHAEVTDSIKRLWADL